MSCLPTILSGQLENRRPKIGLVLSGGAVKGIAHVGVIKVLEEAGIIPDYITGTSIGSIIGGLYSIGYSASQLEEIAKETSWSYYFNDDWSRTSIPLDKRQQNEKYLFKFEWSKNGIKLPKSFVYGEKLSLLLSRLTIPGHGINNFSDFPIPFSCVATDLITGEPETFKQGDIALAMRASMSLPSVFEPVTIDGKTYVDGGISRNFPIQDALDMGAEFIIAVDVEAGLLSIDKITSVLHILDQTISFRINDSSSKQRKLADIIIKPDLSGITGLSFNRIEDLLRLGEEAARQALPKIKETLNNVDGYNNKNNIETNKEYKIANVLIESGHPKTDKIIRSIIGTKEHSTVNILQLEKNVTSLYTTEWIRNFQYRFINDGDNNFLLKIDAETRPSTWIKLGVNYDSDLKAAIGFGLFKRNILVEGSSGRVNLRISENPSAEVNFMTPLFSSPRSTLNINSMMNFYPANGYVNGKLINQFKLHHFQSSIKYMYNLGNNSTVSLGFGREQFTQNRKLYEPSKDEMRMTQTFIPLTFQYDSYDHPFFPKSGLSLNVHSNFIINGKLERIIENQVINFSKLNFVGRMNLNHVLSFSQKLVAINGIDLGVFNYEANSFINSFFLGRSLTNEITHVSFTGLQYMGELATKFIAVKSQFRFELKPNIFLSAIANYGRKELTVRRNTFPKTLLGAGLELGYNSAIGPVRVSAEYGNIHKQIISYIHIGYYF